MQKPQIKDILCSHTIIGTLERQLFQVNMKSELTLMNVPGFSVHSYLLKKLEARGMWNYYMY